MLDHYSGWHWLNADPERRIDPPARQRLARIRCPTLVIVGERDMQDFLAIADVLASEIPNARLVTLPGVGHMTNVEAPEAFNALLLEFLMQPTA
jgi:pimeloyl-ACP methyl ester carboxylesterase